MVIKTGVDVLITKRFLESADCLKCNVFTGSTSGKRILYLVANRDGFIFIDTKTPDIKTQKILEIPLSN